jgi:hypothetical protein
MMQMLLFRDVLIEHAKVNHGPFVGLPSMTGVFGLGRSLCLDLCEELRLEPSELRLDAALFAYDRVHLHEGYKKGFKPESAEYEAVPAAWASFGAHLAFRIQACSDRAASALALPHLRGLAADRLEAKRLCKGTVWVDQPAVDLGARVPKDLNNDVAQLLAALPPRARIVRDRSVLVEDARRARLPLMETLIAATLRRELRPRRWREFFDTYDEELRGTLAPVLNGFLFLEDSPSLQAQKADVFGRLLPSRAASATFTLAELQTVASARCRLAEDPDVLWAERITEQGVFLHGYGSPCEYATLA